MFDPGRGSLDAWMTTIARNAALDWVRMKRAIPIDPLEMCASPVPGCCDPEDRSGIEEHRTEIRSALSSLSPTLVRSVVLAGAFDMTAAQVARYEHIPLGTAKSRIRVAKQRLQRELDSLRSLHVQGDSSTGRAVDFDSAGSRFKSGSPLHKPG